MVRLRSEAIERYRVDYVAGLSTAGFSYFLTNQRDKFELTNSGLLPTVSGDLTSRIIQVSLILPFCECCPGFGVYAIANCRCHGRSYDNDSLRLEVEANFDIRRLWLVV